MSRGAAAGAAFQELINYVNEAYERLGRACITRKSVPGKYIRGKAAFSSSRITLAEYRNQAPTRTFIPESKAEPDYGGVIAPDGRAIFFDAKTTKRKNLDFDNLHAHQIDFLVRVGNAGAIAGFLVEFSQYGKVYFLPIQHITEWRKETSRKSIPHSYFVDNFVAATPAPGILFDYLGTISCNSSFSKNTALVAPKTASQSFITVP